MPGEPIFSSRAYLYTYESRGLRRSVCFDAGLAELVSKSYRALALIYPPDSCHPVPLPSAPTVEAETPPGRMFQLLLESCREAERVHMAWKKRNLLLRLFSPPTLEEIESGEAYHAMIVCNEMGLWEAELVSVTRAWLWYRDDTSEWRRLNALMRIDEGLADNIAGLLANS